MSRFLNKQKEVMHMAKKMSGNERRKSILNSLKNKTKPVTGQEIAFETGVSRQVIVQDISLLKAANQPIIATNRGYLYIEEVEDSSKFHRKVVCEHTPEETQKELFIMVDNGVKVIDVVIEHAYYGELTGTLMIESRYDATEFVKQISKSNAALLSELTEGYHVHTLEADTEAKLDAACAGLRQAGILKEATVE